MTLHFVDTNVLLYSIDDRDKGRQDVAIRLLSKLDQSRTGVISTQVALEFTYNLTRKFKVSRATAGLMTTAFLKWKVVESDVPLVMLAMARSAQSDLSIWDSMVVEAALRAGAQTLYTEDLNHGQRFGPLQVVNPFLP